MPSSCPIDYYKYHLFGSIVKMQKNSDLSATSIDEFVIIFNSSKLYIYICIIIFILFLLFFQNNLYLIIITIAGCGFFFVFFFFFFYIYFYFNIYFEKIGVI